LILWPYVAVVIAVYIDIGLESGVRQNTRFWKVYAKWYDFKFNRGPNNIAQLGPKHVD